MAIITNTVQTTAPKTNREKLADVVSRVYPEDTPIYSDIGTETIDGVHPEWPEQTINAPADNAQLEGDEFTFDAALVPSRLGNYTQILRRSNIISDSQQKADDAASQVKVRQMMLDRALEIKRDVEYSIVAANASVAGTTRKSGSLSTWLTTNVSRGATGANGGFSSGTGLTVAPTNGTLRAFTQTQMDDVMQSIANAGGKVRNVYTSLYNKRVFVSFMSNSNVATMRYNTETGKGNSLVSNADFYEGPYGKVAVKPNTVMTQGGAAIARNAFFIDPDMASWVWFRPIQKLQTELAKTGDSNKLVVLGEGCLKVRSEKAHGVVADVFGMTAST